MYILFLVSIQYFEIIVFASLLHDMKRTYKIIARTRGTHWLHKFKKWLENIVILISVSDLAIVVPIQLETSFIETSEYNCYC